jgi:hypothetical protein
MSVRYNLKHESKAVFRCLGSLRSKRCPSAADPDSSPSQVLSARTATNHLRRLTIHFIIILRPLQRSSTFSIPPQSSPHSTVYTMGGNSREGASRTPCPHFPSTSSLVTRIASLTDQIHRRQGQAPQGTQEGEEGTRRGRDRIPGQAESRYAPKHSTRSRRLAVRYLPRCAVRCCAVRDSVGLCRTDESCRCKGARRDGRQGKGQGAYERGPAGDQEVGQEVRCCLGWLGG